MKLSPELEAMAAADDTPVQDRNARRDQRLGAIALFLGGIAAAYLVVTTSGEKNTENIQSDEEFQTTTFRPPSFLRETEKPSPAPEQPVINLPPPAPPEKPPPETTTFDVPPPKEVAQPPMPPSPIEEAFPKRYMSKLIAMDEIAGGNDGRSLRNEGSSGVTVAGADRNSTYLNAASNLASRSAKARRIERIDAMITEGTLIPGILETAINSDLPGQIRAITSQDVYSFDGRRILIPTGTRLIGEYQSEITRGQKRIFVIWTRLIRDDGVSVRLDSIATDGLGRSGLTGHVDNKFRERFGASIMLSIVGAGASYLTGYGSERASGNGDDAERGAELARETIAETFSNMANTVLSENLRIAPTINVPQGERIFVYVRQDLDFSALYDDPITEAMKEIRRERRDR
ncbi:type IV secretion system protein VirB10 [Neorhizobium sp. Rsf11]|uniref:Type IV secretion system protein VirB10 n=2 Tax=Neorhizobium TaxID=1525371 RepID=A0ABV0M312_9HYPH|nr:type IV secretion system protein VirB10 [Neorhizobium petrolearium]MCC2609491.1 type IV secretion system protein VirB10 [Neorhizobium petrolearium]WGI69699.1 type IV secretion system protein VirB10 [Neorhizobium petrolearium]